MKLCRDCLHMGSDPVKGAVCMKSVLIDPIYGKHGHYSCSNERTFITKDGCGPEGKHFEPIEPGLRVVGEAS